MKKIAILFCHLVTKTVTLNIKEMGGFIGFIGLLTTFAVALIPPWIALDLLEVPAFTNTRLIAHALWFGYIVLGSRGMNGQIYPKQALLLPFWPLR